MAKLLIDEVLADMDLCEFGPTRQRATDSWLTLAVP